MVAGCLIFVSEKFVAVFSDIACGVRVTSPSGWCAHTHFPASVEWIAENVKRAIDTSENLNDTPLRRDMVQSDALIEKCMARNEGLWMEIRKTYGYRNVTNARSSAWMVSIGDVDGYNPGLRVSAIRKMRNGVYAAWERRENDKHVLLPFTASGEALAEAVLRMLEISTLSGRTMRDVAAAREVE